ncbi:hypothetical protein KGQ24_01730, partial [Patescibacteria group bacterium]|nr:hypothetical protein [Patescibacteria group bacterium]
VDTTASVQQQAGVQQTTSPQTTARYFSYLTSSDASFASLQKNLSKLDAVIPEWLRIDASGHLITPDPQTQQQQFSYIKQNSGADIYVLVKNYSGGAWLGDAAANLLAQPQWQQAMAKQLSDYVVNQNLNGISFDFEQLPPSAQANYAEFIGAVKNDLPKEAVVSVNVPGDDSSWNYGALAAKADSIVVMLYDQHNTATSSGPVASAQWFESSLKNILATVPAEKLVAGLGNYAYDWGSSGKVSSYTVADAQALAAKYGAAVHYDAGQQADYFDYSDSAGTSHTVWLADAKSLESEMSIAGKYGISSFALYRLGSEDSSSWNYFGK